MLGIDHPDLGHQDFLNSSEHQGIRNWLIFTDKLISALASCAG